MYFASPAYVHDREDERFISPFSINSLLSHAIQSSSSVDRKLLSVLVAFFYMELNQRLDASAKVNFICLESS